MARADKGMGGGVAGGLAGPDGSQAPGTPDGELTEGDLAQEKMGHANEQGTDPNRLSNTRETAPGGQKAPDASPTESAKMLDKDVRAQAEMGKGNRYAEDHDKNDHDGEDAPDLPDPEDDPAFVGKSL